MNITIVNSLTSERSNLLTIGTHNGIFHSDDVLACAILCLANSHMSIQILRSGDTEILKQCDVCVDIGSDMHNNYQQGINPKRENGIEYASAGAVWKNYGKIIVNKICRKYFSEHIKSFSDFFISFVDTESVVQSFNDSFITLVDCEDNGIKTETHYFSFISSFLPLWFNDSTDDFNNQFHKAVLTTMTVLEESLKTTIRKEIAKNIIKSKWASDYYFYNGILEIPAKMTDWAETVVSINASSKVDNKINFVIFPYPAGGWAGQCVPQSLVDKLEQRKLFPAKWAGQTDKLPEISGIVGATFCDNGRFFVRATSKDAIIEMCTIATSVH